MSAGANWDQRLVSIKWISDDPAIFQTYVYNFSEIGQGDTNFQKPWYPRIYHLGIESICV